MSESNESPPPAPPPPPPPPPGPDAPASRSAPPPPPPPAPTPPPTPAAPPPPPSPVPSAGDGHAVGWAVNRLSAGLTGGPRKNAHDAALILSVLLHDGEVVECINAGTLLGQNGIVALTDQRLMFVTDREWEPDVFELPVDKNLTVAGMQDERTATLTFQSGEHAVVLEKISDRPLAMEMAQRVRARAT